MSLQHSEARAERLREAMAADVPPPSPAALSRIASKHGAQGDARQRAVPFRTITPATWKRAAGIPAGKGMKDLARSRAIERWPGHAEAFARKLDHDRAEAALIGWAGLQREGQGR